MGEAEPAQSVNIAPILRYEDVPQKVAVVRNGEFLELVIPTRPGWRVWAVRQAIWAGFFICGWTLWMFFPVWFSGGAAATLPMWWLAIPATLAVIFVGFLVYRTQRAPGATILRWDGEVLHAPSLIITGGRDHSSGDPIKWSKAALADLEVHPLWPVSLTGCGTVKVVSRFDYPLHVGLYPIAPLQEALAEFRSIVLPENDETADRP